VEEELEGVRASIEAIMRELTAKEDGAQLNGT